VEDASRNSVDEEYSVSMKQETRADAVELVVGGVKVNVATIRREGARPPVVFLHGFGSTKEDYADFSRYPMFAEYPFIAYDAPGFGETTCHDLSQVSIPFLANTARALFHRLGVERFHLIGHSMGGLTALLLAQEELSRVLSLISIEGNMAPEDCFFSRQIFTRPASDPDAFLDDFIRRIGSLPLYSCALYAANLRHKVRSNVVRGIFASMVELSDNGDLMERFLSLPAPRMFVYGEQNAHLSYLPRLQANGVKLARISYSGHFPMYSNPVELWGTIAAFLAKVSSSGNS
jgi:pimeloyl-ACP methyl ester carboxylesterase